MGLFGAKKNKSEEAAENQIENMNSYIHRESYITLWFRPFSRPYSDNVCVLFWPRSKFYMRKFIF